MTFSFLWTDIMVWFLVISLLVWSRVISRSPQVKKQWHTIFKSSIAMASAIILLFYLLFTLLDSVHLRFSTQPTETKSEQVQYGEIVSLLDLLFTHNIESTERTYSAPFATHEYTSSIVVDENGVTKQEYLPLKHVSDGNNIVSESIFAIFIGLIIGGSLIFVHMVWRKKIFGSDLHMVLYA